MLSLREIATGKVKFDRDVREVLAGGAWPDTPGGLGPTLELVDPAVAPDLCWNWAASNVGLHGTFWWMRGLHMYFHLGESRALALAAEPGWEIGTAFCFGDGSSGACPCGNMGAAGCVAWMFHKRGVLAVEKRKLNRTSSSPGITFVAPVPAWMFEHCHAVGGK